VTWAIEDRQVKLDVAMTRNMVSSATLHSRGWTPQQDGKQQDGKQGDGKQGNKPAGAGATPVAPGGGGGKSGDGGDGAKSDRPSHGHKRSASSVPIASSSSHKEKEHQKHLKALRPSTYLSSSVPSNLNAMDTTVTDGEHTTAAPRNTTDNTDSATATSTSTSTSTTTTASSSGSNSTHGTHSSR
jgi:hypothetical protein